MGIFVAPDGAKISYDESGSGRPLVLLHGLMASAEFFAPQQILADNYRLITIDLRGHGSSSATGELTIAQLADDVGRLADQLDLSDAILVGWSLGASVLWRVLTGAAGHRFSASVVIDMTPKVLNEGDWTLGLSREVCDARSAAMRDDFEAFAASAAHAMFAQPLTQKSSDLAASSGERFARNAPAAIQRIWASLVAEDLRPLLKQIEQTTLIIHGAHSQLYGRETADYLAAALPNARVISFGRSGHAPHLEEPESFNTEIREFAGSHVAVRELQNMP